MRFYLRFTWNKSDKKNQKNIYNNGNNKITELTKGKSKLISI